MAETTNLKLFKHDNPSTNDAEFDIDNALNDNWDKIDEIFGNVNDVIVEMQTDVESLKSENDTQNENIGKNTDDISTLKTEKEALEKEVQNLREDNRLNSLTEDNEGELINITNTTGARFNSLEICGNEKQESQDGTSNLLVLEEGSKSQNGVAVTVENGSVTISGTATESVQVIIGKAYLHEGETYYIEKHGTSLNADFRLQKSDSGTQHWFATSGEVSFVAETTGEWELLMSTNEAQNPSATNLKLRVSKESGIEWEQGFMNTPSFDYPSEIKAVGDNVNVFNDEAYKGFVVTQQNYNALEKIDLKLENNKYYVAKIYFEDGTSVAVNNSNFMLYAYKADGTQSANIPNQIAKTYSNAEELVKAKIVANSTGLSTYANKVIKGIKIEEVADADGQPSPYSDYNQGCIELNIINKNFLDIEKNASVEKGGVTVKTDENGVLTLNGTTTTNIYIKLNGKDIMDNNISNWKKSCFRKGIYKFTSEVLTTTQAGNISAFLRKDAYKTEGQYATLYQLMNAKTKTATANILEDTEAVVYLWIASGITLNNAKLKFQIELADTATDIVANEEQNYVIPVQQRMFKQDKFIKINGVWKEMHTMGTVYSKDVSNIVVSGSAVSGVDGFYRYNVNLGISNRKGGSYIRLYSNYFKYGDSRWNNKEGICGWENGQTFSLGTYNKNYDTAEKLKTFLVENNVEFDYELAKPLYLDCTDEQIAVLDKIEKEAHTYSEVTNVYTEDKVGAIIKTNTNVDLKTVINNVVEAQLEQIGG